MNRQTVLKFLNVFLLLDFLCLVATVLLNETLPRNVFYRVHPIFGSVLIILVVLHLILNWNWVRSSYIKKGKK
jgi:hypothetical protein